MVSPLSTQIIDLDLVATQAMLVAGVVFVLAAIAEYFHARRIRRAAYLIFGPTGEVPPLVPVSALCRIVGISLLAFGFFVFAQWFGTYEPRVGADAPHKVSYPHRVVIAYDVSPSMYFARDAGPQRKQLRWERARDVYRSVIERLRTENCLYSLVIFWTDAKPVVIDTFDIAILDNIFNGLPLPYAMQAGGKTELPKVLQLTSDLAKDWHENSATLVFITDGDVLPEKGLPILPKAYANILVFGVGDATRGTFIDDRISRQSRSSLNDLANRYAGVYFNANELYPSSDVFANMRAISAMEEGENFNIRFVAKLALFAGAILFIIPGILLSTFASRWFKFTQREDVHG